MKIEMSHVVVGGFKIRYLVPSAQSQKAREVLDALAYFSGGWKNCGEGVGEIWASRFISFTPHGSTSGFAYARSGRIFLCNTFLLDKFNVGVAASFLKWVLSIVKNQSKPSDRGYFDCAVLDPSACDYEVKKGIRIYQRNNIFNLDNNAASEEFKVERGGGAS